MFGISLGTSQTSNPLYNASATMSAINFTHSDSEGEEITLFGQTFTVSSDTSTTSLVLLKEAEKMTLSSDAPTSTVTIGGATYTVELISSSDTAATIQVTNSAGETGSKEINEADSKKVNGLQIAVQTADETNLKLTATIIAGAKKLTLAAGSSVTEGDNNDPVDGTFVYLSGGTGATTEIAITVYRPDSSHDAIIAGTSFEDPVFGSFKLDFVGLSTPVGDTTRETITVANAGDKAMSLTFTDSEGNEKTIDIAYNGTYAVDQGTYSAYLGGLADWRLADDSNYTIFPHEAANLTEDDYTILGNEDYGHIVQVLQIYNNTGTDYTSDQVKFSDLMSGETYSSSFTSEGSGTLSIDGKQYTVTFLGSGDTGYTQLEYPTSDSAVMTGTSDAIVVYPTIETKNGANLALYEPMNISLNELHNGTATANSIVLHFPDGDDYTPVTLAYLVGDGTTENWTVSGGSTTFPAIGTGTAADNSTTITIGQLQYNISADATANRTAIYLLDPENAATAILNEPSVVIFENKNDQSRYEAVVVNFETAPGGSSSNGAGIDDVLFTVQEYHDSATMASDSDFTMDVNWYGMVTTIDASDSDQKTIELSYPPAQVYAQLYLGESDSVVSGGGTTAGTALGDVLVKDSEVSSVSSKNLIVIGGSCINSAAATLVGGAYCGSGWTDETSVGTGQFLIESFGDAYTTGKIALLVAGYDVADTVNAATYVRTQTVDTTAGKKYIGTTATSATLQVA